MLRLEPEANRVGYCCWQPPEIGRTLTTRNSGVVDAEALAPALAGAIVPVTWTLTIFPLGGQRMGEEAVAVRTGGVVSRIWNSKAPMSMRPPLTRGEPGPR